MRRICVAATGAILLAVAGCSADGDLAAPEEAEASADEDEGGGAESDEGGEGGAGADRDRRPHDSDAGPDADREPGRDAGRPEDTPEDEGDAPEPLQGLTLELVAEGFHQPLDVTVLPGSDDLLVAERTGDVLLVEDGRLADEAFLSLEGTVNSNSIEQGLLGVAPHPDYPNDPRVFVFHSLPDNNNVLVSYTRDESSGRADPDSRTVLLTIDKEPDKVRHNGGHLVFGPDGYLYVGLGDAARASVNGQDPSTLPGSILRLDVDGGDPYGIPSDNPFADGSEGAPEVWWFGLRNPWRFSIDEPSGLAYIADVGQETVEEVNVVPFDTGGTNFGWPSFEGTDVFYPDVAASEVTDPVLEVRHDEEDRGCSITGGLVYRGAALPEFTGHYFYADWCHGWIRSFRYHEGRAADINDWSGELETDMIAGFGVDADGELLVVDYRAGRVSRIVAVR